MLRDLYRHRISFHSPKAAPAKPNCQFLTDRGEKRPILDYTRHKVAASDLWSLSQHRQRGDDG
jgi:hypothetical protein